MIRCFAMCVCALLLAGCSKPQPPDKERPPEPQAAQLRDAMQRDLDTARKAQQAAADAARARDAALEAADG